MVRHRLFVGLPILLQQRITANRRGDAHALRRQGVDIVIGYVETHGRAETAAGIGDLEQLVIDIL